MAKKALLDVLEQTIGKYVKNLDAESLNVAVWSGKIALNNLELDVAAVNAELDRQAAEAPNLALPLQVLSGQFQSFEVDVPWASLTSRSVVLRARGLHISVRPHDRLATTDPLQTVVGSEEARAVKIRQAREGSIQFAEKYRQQAYAVRKLATENDGIDDNAKASDLRSSSFSSRLMRRIIENIQIEIKDVHIAVADGEGTAGCVLESLSLVTTDKDGKRVFVDRTKDRDTHSFLHKVLLMEGFGVYLDHENSKTEKFVTAKTSLGAIQEAAVVESGGVDDDDADPPLPAPAPILPHSYVLAPLSFRAKLRQADGQACIDYPKYQLSSELSSLSILLSRNQLELARHISKQVSSSEGATSCPLFPEYRPLTRVTSGKAAREWWKYAVRCIGRLNGRRSWVEFFYAYQKRKEYVSLYKRQAHHQTCSWIKPLNPLELDTFVKIEQDRTISVDGLMAWRNIAAGQVEKEREKRTTRNQDRKEERSSYFSSIFGSSKAPLASAQVESEEDEPPIHLSIEELRELEAMSREQFDEQKFSKDSKLYDIKFVLNALKINLTSYDMRHLAALEMGAVSVDFAAVANGAFDFNFDLLNLEIQDRVTPNSLFPSVLKSLPTSERDAAFHLHLSKTKSADQRLELRLAAFEAVASQMLFRELEHFFSVSSSSPQLAGKKSNPILAQSLSGSVDLFYDADQGASLQLQPNAPEDEVSTPLLSPRGSTIVSSSSKSPTTSTDLSNVLVEAWKEKTATKAVWIMDVDIRAPVIIIPEKCDASMASILVFDLGHLKFTYGKIDPPPRVVAWLKDHPREIELELTLDSGNLAINDLTFKVGRAKDWRLLTRGVLDPSSEYSVIDPISLSLDYGVESTVHSEEPPRFCCIGVIPTVSMRMSPIQGSNIFSVIGSWMELLAKRTDKMPDSNEDSSRVENEPSWLPTEDADRSAIKDASSEHGKNDQTQFFFLIALQRLSITISLDARNRLEAHLVSVFASMQHMVDGSSVIGLRMGWFWILDMLECSHLRRQRLLAHSNLPRSPQSFAENHQYDVLDELKKQGVFDVQYSGSTELADITYRTVGPRRIEAFEAGGQNYVKSTLEASFSSLFIHWNPHAVKGVSALIERFSGLADEYDDASSLIVSPGKTPRERREIAPVEKETTKVGQMQVWARMQRLDLNLNSARDDLPLFVLTVSDTGVNMLSSKETLEASLSLGDVQVRTPDFLGKTISSYRILLGLAPGREDSLLTVKYYQGHKAIEKLLLPKERTGPLEAFAEVDLSPMRLCFIQSQVMALVEYCSEGILGALTAKAASSAARKAIEIADSVAGEKLFRVRATSFDLVLPQAAYSENAMRIHAGYLDAEYEMLSDTSRANVELSEVAMHGTNDEDMHESPIRMSLKVLLPSDEVGTIDEQAMQVDLHMSQASFSVSRSQYLQILRTLEGNFSELELFLRDDGLDMGERSVSTPDIAVSEAVPSNALTHAGNQFIEKQRRLHLNVTVEVLALQLCDASLEPIIRIAAVNAAISYRSHPDVSTSSSDVSLQNLVCEDLRHKVSQRQYRFLVRQSQSDSISEDFFYVGYASGNNETSFDFKVGSPQVVLIPDAISEILAFVEKERTPEENRFGITNDESPVNPQPRDEKLLTGSAAVTDQIEMPMVPTGQTYLSRVSAATKTCRIILVDLGGESFSEPGRNSQLTETLVLQGVFSASMTSISDAKNGKLMESDFNGQADSMEIFSAFGKEIQSPLQILEPSEGSIHGSTKTAPDGETEIEIRAAALTSFDFTISMHNAALLSAIVNSLKASVMSETEAEGEEGIDLEGLTKIEAEHIQNLALALETTSDRASVDYQASMSTGTDISDIATTHEAAGRPRGTKIQVKLTLPEAKIAVINDLQGLDEALFRASVTTFVAGCEVNHYGLPDATFDFHVNTSILADYFDTSCNIWNKLLVQPWEITLKGLRAPSRRFHSERLSTTIDLESFPCCISFSEQFLVSLASASRMWSIYSVATAVHLDEDKTSKSGSLKASMAASAARNLITSLPYAIENNTGVNISFSLPGTEEINHPCNNGLIQYFRFEPPKGGGYGGKRTYGQDLKFEKSVTIHLLDGSTILIGHLDHEFGLPRRVHKMSGGGLLLTRVVKEGKTTVLHLTSHVSVVNNTCLPFRVSFEDGVQEQPIGTCVGQNLRRGNDTPLATSESGIASKESKGFSVPVEMLASYHKGWVEGKRAALSLSIYPMLPGADAPKLHGIIAIATLADDLRKSGDGKVISKFDVVCSKQRDEGRSESPLVVQVVLKTSLIQDNEAQIDVCLEPRAIIENKFPIRVNLRTPMPHTFSSSPHEEVLGKDVIYSLENGDRVEVFTPGPSIAITMKTAATPISGCDLGWMDGGWIDLPLVSEFKLLEPVRCLLPFNKERSEMLAMSAAVGNEFFIAEGAQSLADLAAPEEDNKTTKGSSKVEQEATVPSPETPLRTFFVTVCYYGIDHTGDVLFAQLLRSDPVVKATMNDSASNFKRSTRRHSRRLSAPGQITPFGAFGSSHHHRRITLLPSGSVPLQILQMTMEGDAGFRRSLPFFVEELPIGEGGVDTIPLRWEDSLPSGYYAYRSIVNEHQSEVHVVPEFLVFNGSHQIALVKERGQPEVIVEGGKVSRLGVATRQNGLEIAVYFIEIDCCTSFIRVDKLGMKMAILQSNAGVTLGSVCVQTVIDTHGEAGLP